jgi:uncharacterized repeat protein (TIGR01451 family)
MPPIFNRHRKTGVAVFAAAIMATSTSHAQDFNPGNDVVSRVIELQQPFQQTASDAASKFTSGVKSVGERLAQNPVAEFTANKIGSAKQAVKSVEGQFSPSNVKFDFIGAKKSSAAVASQVPATPVSAVKTIGVSSPTTDTTQLSFSKTSIAASKADASHSEINRTAKTPIVTAEIATPHFVNVNQPTDVKISLRNAGSQNVQHVHFSIIIPEGTEFVSSSPKPISQKEGVLKFEVSGITSNQNREIALRVIPKTKRTMNFETQLEVIESQTVSVSVRQPKLVLNVEGPSQVNIGDTTTHIVTIANTGDGYANAVRLQGNFPDQLRFINQQGMSAPKTLAPGKSMKVQIKSLAKLPGQVKLDFTAQGVDVEATPAVAALKIAQPELKVFAAGPNLNFVNQDGIYTIKVDNSGEVTVSDVEVVLAIPHGMKVTTINRQAKMNEADGTLQWTFPVIKAQTTETIQLKAIATQPGQQVCNILVSSKETREKEFKLTTEVASRADLSINMLNNSGPVRVGAKATLEVAIENRGSGSANDIEVEIELPDSLMPVENADLLVDRAANRITFLDAKMNRGEKRNFKFEVVGVAKGEHIVRSVLKTSASERRVIVEDSVYVFETNEARVSENLSPVLPR